MPHPPAVQELIRRHPLLGLIGNTPLVPVQLFRRELPEIELLVKCEFLNPGGSVKDRPVLRMLAEAVVNGTLPPDKTILDSSSGNAGIAYAMIGSILGHRVELVVPGNASEERKKRIRAHGATLVLTDPVAGYDEAAAHRAMTEREYTIRMDLGMGEATCRFVTCDLTAEYVRINADYST